MEKDYSVYFRHILDAINLIEGALVGKEFSNLQDDQILSSAITYQLIIIAEAINRIPLQILEDESKVPWKKIKATRNRLVHDYYKVDIEILWQIISHDLAELKKEVESMLVNNI